MHHHRRRPPTILFVHGGMWQSGSKDQSPIDMYDIASLLWNLIGGRDTTGESSSTSVAATLPLYMNGKRKRYVTHPRPQTTSKSSDAEAKALH